MTPLRLLPPLLLLLALAACNPGGGSGTTNDPPATDVARLEVTLTPATLAEGETATATAVGYDEDGNAYDSVSVEWSSSDTTVATIDADGGIDGKSKGSATITATAGGTTDAAELTIVPASDAPAGMSWEPTTGQKDFYRATTAFTMLPDGQNTWLLQTETDGMWRSRDNGDTWRRIGDGVRCSTTSPAFTGLIAYPWDGRLVLAYCDDEVFRSEDGGVTWNAAASEDASNLFSGTGDLAPARHEHREWLSQDIIRYGGLASSDRGRTWHALPFDRFTVSEADPATWWATDGTGLHKTTDAGATWVDLTARVESPTVDATPCGGTLDPKAVATTPDGTLHLIATQACPTVPEGDYANLTFASTDDGETWELQQTSYASEILFADGGELTVNPHLPNNLHYMVPANSSALRYSNDGGTTWSEASEIASWGGIVTYHPTNLTNHVFVTGPNNWVSISADNGRTWLYSSTTTNIGTATLYRGHNVVPIDQDTYYYAGHILDDRSRRWTELVRPDPDLITPTHTYTTNVSTPVGRISHDTPDTAEAGFANFRGMSMTLSHKLHVDREDRTRVVSRIDPELTNDPLTMIETTDALADPWLEVRGTLVIAQATGDPGRWYLAEGDVLATSHDHRATFTNATPLPNGLTPTKFVVSHQDADLVYAATSEGVYKTRNGASTWLDASTGLGDSPTVLDLVVAPDDDETLYVATSAGVYATADGGDAWTDVTGDLPLASHDVLDLELTPDGTMLFAIVEDDGLFRTSGDGTWTNVTAGLPTDALNDLEIDPTDANVLYAATPKGAFKSTTRGGAWSGVNGGLPFQDAVDIAVSHDGTRVYVALRNPTVTFSVPTPGLGTDVYIGTPSSTVD